MRVLEFIAFVRLRVLDLSCFLVGISGIVDLFVLLEMMTMNCILAVLGFCGYPQANVAIIKFIIFNEEVSFEDLLRLLLRRSLITLSFVFSF